MRQQAYPRLGEKVSRRTLSNGLEVVVVEKPDRKSTRLNSSH